MKNKLILILTSVLVASCGDKTEIVNYHSNGKVSERFFINEKENIEGKAYFYYKNGNLKEEKTFKNGVLSGEFKAFYESGKLEHESFLINGKLNGEVSYFNEAGQLTYIQNYQNDSVTYEKGFYPNGKMKRIHSSISFVKYGMNSDINFNPDGSINYGGTTRFVNLSKKRGDILTISLYGDVLRCNDSITIYVKRNIRDEVTNKWVDAPENFIRRVKLKDSERKKMDFKIYKTDYVNGKLNLELLCWSPLSSFKHPNYNERPLAFSYFIQLDKDEVPKKYNLDYIEE